MSRSLCLVCFKPEALCVCASVPRLRNRTGVIVLQHLRERGHALGTERLVRLGFGARVEVLFSEKPDGSSEVVDLPEGAMLLYPSPDAVLLDPGNPPSHLVVVDGTWSQAHQLHRDNPWIRALPHVQLSPTAPSRYRIRREPRADYVSTLEAVCEALVVLEPDLEGIDGLLSAFDAMIDGHLAHRGTEPRVPRRRNERKGRSRAVPWELVDHPERAVVVHVEPGVVGRPRPLVRISAVRVSDGAVFDAVVAEQELPGVDDLAALGLGPSELAGARPLPEVLAALVAFWGVQPMVLPWRPHHGRWLVENGVQMPGWLAVSAVWRNVTGEAPPDVVSGPAVGISGRAGVRLAAALGQARALSGGMEEEVGV